MILNGDNEYLTSQWLENIKRMGVFVNYKALSKFKVLPPLLLNTIAESAILCHGWTKHNWGHYNFSTNPGKEKFQYLPTEPVHATEP